MKSEKAEIFMGESYRAQFGFEKQSINQIELNIRVVREMEANLKKIVKKC